MSNRLSHEKSPYLLQHADNPVDWMPWGDEAFERAKAEDKPILVSIGYSTCHWCHVMEHESFSDPKVAALMNEGLICVKVDREERPDVDRVYMNAVTALTGQGGWPLNCFITPEGKPFYGGTYYPPRPMGERPSWPQLVDAIVRAWKDLDQRAHVLHDAERLTLALKGLEHPTEPVKDLNPKALDGVLADFRGAYDEEAGGFSGAPKFPMPVYQHFLFRWAFRLAQLGRNDDAADAADMALATLRKMAKGGIYDQLGGGFSRYSTDDRWHVPHFEKMLYDNAQLAMNYVEAWQLSRDPIFAQTAEGVLGYVLRDLGSPEGAFYSAEDADSLPADGSGELKEGAFYTWSHSEIYALLGGEEASRFCSAYGVERDGNVHDDPHGEFGGLNVLYDRRGTLAAMAGFGDEPEDAQEALLEQSRRRLFGARLKRPRPRRDGKILTSWNGLMIAALAKASAAFERPEWAVAAARAADFLLENLWDKDSSRLQRRYAGGEAALDGQADDYAFLAWGLLELHQATLEGRWLAACRDLLNAARTRFFDEQDGLYFSGGIKGDPRLPARVKDAHDNVEPAPASVFAELQLRLWGLGLGDDWRADAEKTLKGHLQDLKRAPRSLPFMAAALDRALSPPRRLVIAGRPSDPRAQALLAVGRDRWLPDLDRLWAGPGADYPLMDGRPAAYLCEGFSCKAPVSEPAVLKALLAVPE
ncbi:MAG: thioredoxin domain-containing protein [bacterium]